MLKFWSGICAFRVIVKKALSNVLKIKSIKEKKQKKDSMAKKIYQKFRLRLLWFKGKNQDKRIENYGKL
jgi:hypothetical protein